MFDDFLVRAFLAGLAVALAAAPLGCLVVWRRMAYFGDAIAHAAILGVAFSLLISTSPIVGVLIVSVLAALIVANLSGGNLAEDTILGVVSHGALAFGLVAVSFGSGPNVDLVAYLFGDILSIGKTELALVWVGTCGIWAIIFFRWSNLLTATLDPDLAYVSGINPNLEKRVITLAIAVTVALAIKIVGALLITALLIIPAATARSFSTSPEHMVAYTALNGILAVVAGLLLSVQFDTPTGPTIICVAAVTFCISQIVGAMRAS